MAWGDYLAILRRRWWIIAAIVLIDILASGYLYRKAHTAAGTQSCMTLYVADVSAPSLIAAPPTTLETAGQLLAGETAANFFADDILDVAQSRSVAAYMLHHAEGFIPAGTDFNGTVSGSRKDRTVDLCVTVANSGVALRGAAALASAMTRDRAQFVGTQMAHRTYVQVISAPLVSVAPVSNARNSLLLRLALGVLVALGVALLWDAVDPGPPAATA